MKNPILEVLKDPPRTGEPYLPGLKGATGDIYAKHSLRSRDFLVNEMSVYSPGDYGVVIPYGQATTLAAFKPMKVEKLSFSPEAPLRIAVQPRSSRRNVYVSVKVIAYQEGKALCKARYKGNWLEIELDRSSLERMDLRAGDTFEWIPNEEGTVKDQDIRSHPRREDAGERERTEKAFDDLAAMVQKTAV